jgi:hypothetical protein
MRSTIELPYSFLESYFDFNNPEKTTSQKLLIAFMGLTIPSICISISIIELIAFNR